MERMRSNLLESPGYADGLVGDEHGFAAQAVARECRGQAQYDGALPEAVVSYFAQMTELGVAGLSAAEERDLATQLQAGLRAEQELIAYRQQATIDDGALSSVRIRQLEQLVAAGERAKWCLVEANLPWVVNIATRYQGRGLGMADLIQAGNTGLIIAAMKLDPSKGRLTTYSFRLIRQEILSALRMEAHIILPPWQTTALRQLEGVRARLEVELGRRPRDSEVADELGVAVSRIEELDELRHVFSDTPSLDAPGGELAHGDEKMTLGEAIGNPPKYDDNGHDPDVTRLWRIIHRAGLTPAEKMALVLRFGLGDGGGMRTYEEIASLRDPTIQALQKRKVQIGDRREYSSVSREKVRLVVVGALRKLSEAIAANEQTAGEAAEILQRIMAL